MMQRLRTTAAQTPTALTSAKPSRLFFTAKLLVSIVLVGWLLRMVGLKALAGDIASIGPVAFGLAVLIQITQIIIGTVRWHRVVSVMGGRMSLHRTFSAFYLGVFYNCFLPSSVGGDFVRGWRAHRDGLPLATAVNSVILDRMSTLLGLLTVIMLMSAPLFALLGKSFYVFPMLAAGAISGVAVIMMLGRLPPRIKTSRFVAALCRLSRDCRTVFLNPAVCAEVVGLSVFVALLMGLTVYPLAIGLGLHVSAFDCVLLTVPVVLITILPVSIGGWGLREASFVFALGFVGVPASAAITLSIAFGITGLLAAMPGCVIWLIEGGVASRRSVSSVSGSELWNGGPASSNSSPQPSQLQGSRSFTPSSGNAR